MNTIQDIVRPLGLMAGLLGRFWPQLLLIGCVGYIARDLLLIAAVTVGLQHPLGGMVVLSLVVLSKLLVVVMMFAALRSGLPALASLRHEAPGSTTGGGWRRDGDRMLAVTAAVILPFFAYYAAWGFLGDTVREYSRLALDRVQLGERLQIFELLNSRGLVASILLCWAVRWIAKRMNDRSHGPGWRFLIVAADTSWIFIGLYALSAWKDELIVWLGETLFTGDIDAGIGASLSMAAFAAEGFIPVEFRQPELFGQVQRFFFYALLPLVWLVIAAIINGYELSATSARGPAMTSGAVTWRKWLRDFIAHFLGGYRARYRPVWDCLTLTLGTGLATLLTFVVVYRALNWLSAWLWYGTTRLLGPYDLTTWQAIAGILDILIGSPSDLDGGLLFGAVRIALLAAILEYAVAMRTSRKAREQENAPAT
ncbi:hypothetical protein ABFT80_20365 [Mesorhizobium sp. SB112]|uniref:hypothetical protein n=1 Tax=Mesorhizobium sp. SB112 TaxID=3151853 RepID=UPI003264EBE3